MVIVMLLGHSQLARVGMHLTGVDDKPRMTIAAVNSSGIGSDTPSDLIGCNSGIALFPDETSLRVMLIRAAFT
jgi:hypothetical protein